jgi:hypothetical protein
MVTAFGHPRIAFRLASGVGGLFLLDLIIGMAGFCCISLASLWYFCLGWINLQGEYAAIGVSFGSSQQVVLAWIGSIACLPVLAVTLWLALQALLWPRQLLRRATARGTASA